MRPDSTTFLSTNERKALLSSVAYSQCRLDGRALADLRRVRCRFADGEPGCVSVQVGDTLVVAKVTHEIVEPWSHRPAEGQLQVNLEVPGPDGHGTSGRHQLDDEGLRVQRALERCFKESNCLDLESLCIVPGERVFLMRATATVLNNDGNVIDCSAMAVALALADYRRPDVSLVQGAVRVGENAPVALNLNFYPIVQTFGLLDPDGKYVMADLSAKEEAVACSRVVVAMSANREICCLHTIGGLPLHSRRLVACVRLACRRVRGLAQLLDRAIAARRLDTLDLVPPVTAPDAKTSAAAAAAAITDAEMIDLLDADDEEGELLSSGSDMDIASPLSPFSAAAAAAAAAAASAGKPGGPSTGVGGNPYSTAVVASYAAVAAASGGGAGAAGPEQPSVGEEAATAKHVEFGLRFIRSAMIGSAAASSTEAASATGGLLLAPPPPSASSHRLLVDDDDEEEVTMVTQLI